MWFLLLLLASASAEYCKLNDDSSACNEPSMFSCVDICREYKTKEPCKSFKACDWTQRGECRPLNPTFNCSVYTDAASCGQQPACFPKTSPCRELGHCLSPGDERACYNARNATQCARPEFASLGCNWTVSCRQTTSCEIFEYSQGACTAIPGCYWLEHSLIQNNDTYLTASCFDCFTDPSKTANNYLNAAARLGKTCNITKADDPTYLGVITTQAVVAGSNCIGGVPYFIEGYIQSCPNTQAAAAAGLTTSLAALCLAALLA